MSEPRAEAIRLIGVDKTFGAGAGAVRALAAIELGIAENEFFTLLGPSGCGKTTLLRLIAGFDHPSRGRVLLGGRDITALPPYRRPVNTVFQSYALFPHMTVEQNIAFGLEMLGRPRADIDATVSRMLRLVQLDELRRRRIDELSGGQQQRVALARALAPQPEVLLLDEPLSALDLKLRKNMQLELKRLQHETGITFVFVTHDQEEALTMSDRIAVMDHGEVLQVGSPREIYQHPARRFVADFIGDSNILTATVTAVDAGVATLRLAGGELRAPLPPKVSPDAGPGARLGVAVRPEHARLTEPAEGELRGRLRQTVYFGTDTHYHVELDGGERFVVRAQNLPGPDTGPPAGAEVGVRLRRHAAQVLQD